MALIKCPECGRDISDKAKACIHCGYPLYKMGNFAAENQTVETKSVESQCEVNQIAELNQSADEAGLNKEVKTKNRISGKLIVVFCVVLAVLVGAVLLIKPITQAVKRLETKAEYYDGTFNETELWDVMQKFNKEASIEETELYNRNGMKIVAKNIVFENSRMAVNLYFENNTDKSYKFVAESMAYSRNAINEYMIETGFVSCEVAPHTSAEDAAYFQYDELIMHGITDVAEIQMGFNIFNEEHDNIYTGPVSIITNHAGSYDYNNDNYRKAITSKSFRLTYDIKSVDLKTDTIYQSNNISIVSEAYIVNKDGERTLMLELKNGSNQDVVVTLSDIKANGLLIYDYTWSRDVITSGKKMILSIAMDRVLDEDEWKEVGITELEKIGFAISVENEDGMVVAEPAELQVSISE